MFFIFRQSREMTTPDYYKKFCNLVNIVKQNGRSIGGHKTLVNDWHNPGAANLTPVIGAPIAAKEADKDKDNEEEGDPEHEERETQI
eukprot:1503963-Ditylum_brightwellii.AAC.1